VFKKLFSSLVSSVKRLSITLLVLSLSSCSSRDNPVIYYDDFDFSQVNNYSFYISGSAFFDSQSLSHAQRSRIELAIEKSLNAQAFNYSDVSDADIIVTYHLVENRPQDYQAYNKSVLFCAYCLRASKWKTKDYDWQVYPGGLIIDLVNPKNNRSIWRSIHPLNFKTKDNSRRTNELIMEAVDAMLSQYPTNEK
jgi:hypothetical protein